MSAKIEGVEDAVFEMIVTAALNGEPCPRDEQISGELTRRGMGVGNRMIGTLTKRGRIKVELYIGNFRRAVIMTGEHAGVGTAMPEAGKSFGVQPGGRPILAKEGERPHTIIDKTGVRRRRKRMPSIGERVVPRHPAFRSAASLGR